MSSLTFGAQSGAVEALTRAFNWWLAELRSLLPSRRFGLERSVAASDIWLSSTGIVIDRTRAGSGERLIEERPLESLDDEGWAEFLSLIEGTRARIILGPPEMFTATVSLPSGAKRRLKQATGLQLQEVAPLDLSLLHWNIADVSQDDQKLSVRVGMVRTSTVSALTALFAARGHPVPPIHVCCGDTLAQIANGSEYSGGASRLGARRASMIPLLILATIPFTTLIGAEILTRGTESRIATVERNLAPRLRVEREATEVEKLRRVVKPVVEQVSSAALIENLALALPETSFATEFERLSDGSVRFTVDAVDAEEVSAMLSQTTLLANSAPTDMAPSTNGRIRVSYRSVAG